MAVILPVLPDGTAVTVKINPSPGETVLCWSLSKRMIIILVEPRFCLVNVAPPEFPQILWTISFMHVKFWWYWIHSHCNVFFIAVNNKDKHSFFFRCVLQQRSAIEMVFTTNTIRVIWRYFTCCYMRCSKKKDSLTISVWFFRHCIVCNIYWSLSVRN